MNSALDLRARLDEPGAVVAPGVYDALTALMVEQAGFSCAYVSGASISFTRIGRPDLGLTTLSEVADSVANMRERVSIPLVVDADTGFGNALNVRRSVRLLERMGASGIQLEDQTSPKRCGHLEGKSLISTAEMAGKIRAAVDARHDEATLIVARTDAVATDGIDAAIERGHAFVDRVVSFAGQAYLRELKEQGTTAGMLDRMNQFNGIMDLVGLQESIAEGQAYASDIKDARE
jgi:2-methylisocitrate lyase-like PEP mutase family enzyme